MAKKRIGLLLLLAAVLLLTGCAMQTVDMMYCPPKRSEEYMDLQSAMDEAMDGLTYSAPVSGENQQTVQLADLNGDGKDEYLLFARSHSENPLRILVFQESGDHIELMTTIECLGSGFEQAEYADMDGVPGEELIIGRRVSDQLMGAVSVYSFSGGEAVECMSANYSKFIACDLDEDGRRELLILSAGEAEETQGSAVLHAFRSGTMERSPEVKLSQPADCIKRIMVSRLYGGAPAVYVASSADGSAIVTDVFALRDGEFANISFSNESGTSVQTLRNYFVYADDIDDDGILELPSLIPMTIPEDAQGAKMQYLIRWFSMDLYGREVDKLYTFHNYADGWYLELDEEPVSRLCVLGQERERVFCLWNETGDTAEPIFRITALTGENREAAALENNRFVLYRGESVLYAARLEAASAVYGITEEYLKNAFHLIQQDWKTGET